MRGFLNKWCRGTKVFFRIFRFYDITHETVVMPATDFGIHVQRKCSIENVWVSWPYSFISFICIIGYKRNNTQHFIKFSLLEKKKLVKLPRSSLKGLLHLANLARRSCTEAHIWQFPGIGTSTAVLRTKVHFSKHVWTFRQVLV